MTVRINNTVFSKLSKADIDAWEGAEAASVSDCLERSMAMDGGLFSLDHGSCLIGQARTVKCMVGDNSALHVALEAAEPGEVLVADAGAHLGNAVWGGLMTYAAISKGIKGLVVDGAVRDRNEIVRLGFPCYARGCTPAGPHKGFGGILDGTISCGGVPIRSGDLIVADGDGVSVIPLERVKTTLAKYRELKERENATIKKIDAGISLVEIYGMPDIVQHP